MKYFLKTHRMKNMLENLILNFQSHGKAGCTEIHQYQQKIKCPKRLHDVIERSLEKISKDSVLNLHHLLMYAWKSYLTLSVSSMVK